MANAVWVSCNKYKLQIWLWVLLTPIPALPCSSKISDPGSSDLIITSKELDLSPRHSWLLLWDSSLFCYKTLPMEDSSLQRSRKMSWRENQIRWCISLLHSGCQGKIWVKHTKPFRSPLVPYKSFMLCAGGVLHLLYMTLSFHHKQLFYML